jgi:hypothetical protein
MQRLSTIEWMGLAVVGMGLLTIVGPWYVC